MARDPNDLDLLDALLTGDVDWVPIMQPILVGRASLEETLAMVETTLEKGCRSGRITADELEVIRRRHAEMVMVDSSEKTLEEKLSTGAITPQEYESIVKVNARLAAATSELHQIPSPQISSASSSSSPSSSLPPSSSSLPPSSPGIGEGFPGLSGHEEEEDLAGSPSKQLPHTFTGLYLRQRLSSSVASFFYPKDSSGITVDPAPVVDDATPPPPIPPQPSSPSDTARPVTSSLSRQDLQMTRSMVLNVQFSSWYPLFKDVSFKSEIVSPLPESFLKWLRTDGVSLPPTTPTTLFGGGEKAAAQQEGRDSDDVSWDEDDSDDQGEKKEELEAAFDFGDLDARVESALERLFRRKKGGGGGGGCGGEFFFPKLNWSAPQVGKRKLRRGCQCEFDCVACLLSLCSLILKDASWMNMGSLRCKLPGDAYLLLKASEFVSHDLEYPFDGCCDDESEQGKEEEGEEEGKGGGGGRVATAIGNQRNWFAKMIAVLGNLIAVRLIVVPALSRFSSSASNMHSDHPSKRSIDLLTGQFLGKCSQSRDLHDLLGVQLLTMRNIWSKEASHQRKPWSLATSSDLGSA